MNNLVNSASNISDNLYENNIREELEDTQNYLDQGVTSSDGVQMKQDIFVGPKYGDSSEAYKLMQPVDRVSLNGSQIILPPVPNLHETSDDLGQCIAKVCQIREFLKKVSSERKRYIDSILRSHK